MQPSTVLVSNVAKSELRIFLTSASVVVVVNWCIFAWEGSPNQGRPHQSPASTRQGLGSLRVEL